ncbi:hypothetical protein AB0K60_36660, partial [Thermopolyspora sp. NPDC052614]|uniref:hypothetical protein n=1 Tax=Thermopolyspora sp. NPDC052614 TaxID=3155682 RepID=UPI003426DAE2
MALLQACDPLPEGQAPEDTLLAHERKHRDELATARGLGHPHTRERAVTTAVLFGARGSDEVEARTAACRLIATALDHNAPVAIETQRAVASWIADLYPPATPGSSDPDEPVEFWGPMQPDRMAEFFLARSLDNEPDLPKVTGHLTDRLGASNALLVLSRAVSHNPAAARHIQTLVLAHPELFAPAALWVQTYAENPAPLMEALVRVNGRAIVTPRGSGKINPPALVSRGWPGSPWP